MDILADFALGALVIAAVFVPWLVIPRYFWAKPPLFQRKL